MDKLPIYGETDPTTLRPGLYLALFHGRDTPDEVLHKWGYPGPMLGPLRYVHTTYASEIKFAFEDAANWALAFPEESPICGYRRNDAWRDLPGNPAPSIEALRRDPALRRHPAVDTIFYQTDGWLSIREGLIRYDARFYGDWTVFHHPGASPGPTNNATARSHHGLDQHP
ncbi:hypothetical protein RN01_07380 [Cupriavidus sp. SHE]|jgi:hypothetical protein|uniref:Uncharacterized protein n=1 Tax=Cupriavidus metallidurans TaxID=119219 RepID=A0A482IP16_9BURK|nr:MULTISPECIES: hypothetical protein [Cupriavidus]KWR84318.1 hypothetical protein RN01_07380 [Cupriavidus sp. SHE]QBP09931.1 hypothetical protein DDF84_009220 [Cupriavidus metallidurans]